MTGRILAGGTHGERDCPTPSVYSYHHRQLAQSEYRAMREARNDNFWREVTARERWNALPWKDKIRTLKPPAPRQWLGDPPPEPHQCGSVCHLLADGTVWQCHCGRIYQLAIREVCSWWVPITTDMIARGTLPTTRTRTTNSDGFVAGLITGEVLG